MSSITQRWMGQGNEIKATYNAGDKLAGVLDITRPILSTMGALGVGASAALAYGGFPAWDKCVIGVIAALLAFAGIHSFNDFADRQRDVVCWPGRPLPSKRLNTWQGLTIALGSYTIALILVWFYFNPTCFWVSLIAIALGSLYSGYLRDRIGYLVLPPIEGTLWLCGWAAFSPDTLFTSWAPWILWAFSATWQAGHIMVYSPLHPISHVNNKKLTQVPALFTRTSPQAATIIGFIFLVLAAAVGIFLGFYFDLGLLYIIPTAVMAAVALTICWQYVREPENFGKGIKTFSFATYFMLVARVFMLLSIAIFF